MCLHATKNNIVSHIETANLADWTRDGIITKERTVETTKNPKRQKMQTSELIQTPIYTQHLTSPLPSFFYLLSYKSLAYLTGKRYCIRDTMVDITQWLSTARMQASLRFRCHTYETDLNRQRVSSWGSSHGGIIKRLTPARNYQLKQKGERIS